MFIFQNEEMVTEGELRNNSLDDSDKVKELQDKVADLKAEVSSLVIKNNILVKYIKTDYGLFSYYLQNLIY